MEYVSTVLFVNDVTSVRDFYQDAFGLKVKFYDPGYGYCELETNGGTLGIASHRCGELMMLEGYKKPVNGNPEGVEIAFHTEDVSRAYRKATEAGAVSVAEPREMEWGQTVAYVQSIEGTIIGLCTEVKH